MMSTELTFSRISWLYGLAHGIVTQEQYSFLVVAVIASAVAHTVIAGGMFVPLHLEGFQGIRLSVVPNRFVCYDGRERTEMEFSRAYFELATTDTLQTVMQENVLPAMNQHIGKKVYVTKHGVSIIPRSQTEKKNHLLDQREHRHTRGRSGTMTG
ncbi:MAG: hypothetical protein H8K06_15480 [Nitrospira sp.]|nr:hypothetical protein [Nitrospira sp.]